MLSDLQATPSDERLAALRQAINGGTAGSTEPSPLAAAFGELQSAFTEVRTRNPELMPLLIGIARIRTRPFREALQVILYSVMTFPEALLKLQTWFSDGMQRSSSMFKEKLQKLSLIVACVMVMLMNVDTLSITQVLWEDPEFRASLAAAASAGVRSADITGEPGESPYKFVATPITGGTAPRRITNAAMRRAPAVMVLARTKNMTSGHLAVVKEVLGPRHINVTHSNWGNDRYSRRVIYDSMRVEDASPRNDWTSVRFWNPEKNVFGFPYAARGFIYR